MLDKRFYKTETHPERMNALGKAYAYIIAFGKYFLDYLR